MAMGHNALEMQLLPSSEDVHDHGERREADADGLLLKELAHDI